MQRRLCNCHTLDDLPCPYGCVSIVHLVIFPVNYCANNLSSSIVQIVLPCQQFISSPPMIIANSLPSYNSLNNLSSSILRIVLPSTIYVLPSYDSANNHPCYNSANNLPSYNSANILSCDNSSNNLPSYNSANNLPSYNRANNLPNLQHSANNFPVNNSANNFCLLYSR